MNSLPPLDPTEFGAFFRAVYASDPFPWQVRLARRVVDTGWPRVLDLPTGTGKTAAIDVALFALALDAGRKLRTAPLRLIYVVDRRTIVDQAYERAERIRTALATGTDDVVGRVRRRLESYTHDGPALRTVRLRGGISRDDLWARSPDQPLIAVSTVDQVGSRLLFRGYGVSDSMKPVHAGLLGTDVLYLLDEVHLSQPFRETLTAIRDRYRSWAEQPLPGAFVVIEMSATPGAPSLDAFRLDQDDRQDPRLAARLRASKPAVLESTNPRGFSAAMEKHVLSIFDRPGATIAAVVNRVKAARDLHGRLREAIPNGTSRVHLLTGRMRPFDRDALEASLIQRIRAGRVRIADEEPVVVVATQSIEAGADFDFDGLVTECASLDSLRQRFGRLDRLGSQAGSSRSAIVARSDSLADDPVYGAAVGKTWEWLQATASGAVIDFGIDAMEVPQDAGERGLLAPKANAPILLPSHLDAWVQTSPVPLADPDVALWLHGPERGVADLQIVWRADLTEALLRAAAGSNGGSAESEIALALVDALPPVGAEAMSVPFVAARRWLDGRSEPETSDVEGARENLEGSNESERAWDPRPVVVWQGDQSRVVLPAALRPGLTIVVPAAYGGIEHGNWAPASVAPVNDVAELASLRHGRQPILRLHEAVVKGLFGENTEAPEPGPTHAETLNDRDVVRDWIENRLATVTNPGLRELLEQLGESGRALRVERVEWLSDAGVEEHFLVVGKRRSSRAGDGSGADDDRTTTEGALSSFTGVEISLSEHLAGVADLVSDFGDRVGLSEELASDLRLAAEWHDAGKADPRFQRWLHGGSEFKALTHPVPLAKSRVRMVSRFANRAARERAGYPAGARHELMSLALMASMADGPAGGASDWSLVQHVVASHHGHARPLAPWVEDGSPVDVMFVRDGISVQASSAHGLARLDSGVADRFWLLVRRYGWWGLAWLETLLRLADHRQSERERAGGEIR